MAPPRQPQVTPKRRAYHIVCNAKRTGKLTQPERCERCNQVGQVQAHHHNGYDRPLDVQWLCATCHRRDHAADGDYMGSRNGRAILTEQQVAEIRAAYAACDPDKRRSAARALLRIELAKQYGVSPWIIFSVATRRSWTHIA